ncbi:hypothetical protein N431DRAFT_397262 [Stipitochalara longipes BDJ]|nr:hypothetical protein N431DRAFT_397262 [Stipitochalara longipes BDJ]
MDSPDIIQGACNCGRITVSLPRSSLPTASSLCHCLNCRASGGSLFAVNLPTPTKDITIEGQPKIHSDIAMSGNTADRHFCSDCGSPIMTIIRQRPEISVLKGGLFAKFGVDLPPPGREQFWRRAEKWEKPHEGVATLVE